MELPIIKEGEETYPKEALCPICKENKVFEPHNFVAVSGGACREGESRKSINYGFLNFIWHGHHYENVEDDKKDTYYTMDVVDDSKNGQFELYFCSSQCMRKFFNDIIDLFESEIDKTIKEQKGT